MSTRVARRGLSALAVASALVTAQGTAAAQPFDPSTIAETSGLTRALVSFVVVGLVGVGYLTWFHTLVDRSVDDTMDRPAVAIVYGLLAFVLVLFAGFYANDLLTRVGVAGTPIGLLALGILVGGILAVGGLGYVVVGTLLTDLYAARRPWHGLVLGAAISTLALFVLPLAPALAAWVLLAAIGVGGRTRTWVHNERTVATELDS